MKIQIKTLGLVLITTIALGFVAGCGSDVPPVEVASKQDVNKMTDLRKFYDSAGGDYSKLTEDQKKQFLDFTKGNQSAVDNLWRTMGFNKGKSAVAPNSTDEARKRQMQAGGGG
jgi:hypothetical protein